MVFGFSVFIGFKVAGARGMLPPYFGQKSQDPPLASPGKIEC